MAQTLVVCRYCNQTFVCNRRRAYCSTICAAEARAERSTGRTVSAVCESCGRKYRSEISHHGRFCSARCQKQVASGDVDPVRVVVDWVRGLCGDGLCEDEWSVVRLLFHEQRLLKMGEIAYSLRWTVTRVAPLVCRLESAGVVVCSYACDVEKFNLADFRSVLTRPGAD